MQVVIATKGGITKLFQGYDFSAAALRASLEGSLRRLRTDYVDLFQLHNAGADVVSGHPDIGDALNRFLEEGKIRAYGFSTPISAGGRRASRLSEYRFVSGQLQFAGLARRRSRSFPQGVRARYFDHCPHATGFWLFDRDDHQQHYFRRDDHRSRWSRDKIAAWLEAADALFSTIAHAGYSESRTATALRFCLSFDAVATVIPGMMSPEDVRANVAACKQGPLDLEPHSMH